MPASERVERERDLRRAVLRGDARAWQTLYDAAFSAVFRYVSWRCAGLPDLTEEITQETWLIAVRRIRAFDPAKACFSTWLCGIAANMLRHHFRSRRPAAKNRAVETTASADDDLERRERAEHIARVLADLPERYEAALRMKYLEGLGVAEIAMLWQETPKAVESLLSRARAAFRLAYGPVLAEIHEGSHE
jgi:RNA polymerase sigma-70 factor (ECF subfamily)